MSSINLDWQSDTPVSSYNIYRSEYPIDTGNLPTPIATGITGKLYSDPSVVLGSTYYYRVSSIKNGVEKISEELSILAKYISSQTYIFTITDVSGAIVLSEGDTLCTIPASPQAPKGWMKTKFNKQRRAADGKFYFEVEIKTVGAIAIGIAPSGTSTATGGGGASNAGDGGRVQFFNTGQVRRSGVYKSFATALKAGDKVGICLSLTPGSTTLSTMSVYVNNVYLGNAYTDLSATTLFEPHFCFYLNNTSETPAIKVSAGVHVPDGFQLW